MSALQAGTPATGKRQACEQELVGFSLLRLRPVKDHRDGFLLLTGEILTRVHRQRPPSTQARRRNLGRPFPPISRLWRILVVALAKLIPEMRRTSKITQNFISTLRLGGLGLLENKKSVAQIDSAIAGVGVHPHRGFETVTIAVSSVDTFLIEIV